MTNPSRPKASLADSGRAVGAPAIFAELPVYSEDLDRKKTDTELLSNVVDRAVMNQAASLG